MMIRTIRTIYHLNHLNHFDCEPVTEVATAVDRRTSDNVLEHFQTIILPTNANFQTYLSDTNFQIIAEARAMPTRPSGILLIPCEQVLMDPLSLTFTA